MENLEMTLDEFNNVCERLRNGEYDNLEKEIETYKKLKSILDKAGVKFLDGLELDTMVF